MTSTPEEELGGGFAEVRDGTHVTPIIRPADNDVDTRPVEGGS